MLIPQTYAGGRLNRADAMRRDDTAIHAALLDTRARFVVLDNLTPLMTPDGTDILWLNRDAVGDTPAVFLGLDPEGVPHFAVEGSAANLPGAPVDLRKIGMMLGADPNCALLAQARTMLDWHRRHRYCPACGGATRMIRAGYCRTCENCGTSHFPRVDPVVIMLAVHEDKALVGRQPGFPQGMYSALAGFVEPGESLEEAVARELHEESGVSVANIRYLGSQPWPFPASLMIGAIADAVTTDIRIDPDELEEARWVSRAEVIAALNDQGEWAAPTSYAIAHALLRYWAEI